jgi:lysyl-tRNA synthetase class 1
MNNQPNKHLTFDTGLGLLNLVDEYDKFERTYFGAEEETRGIKDLKKTYEFSQPYNLPKKLPYQLPYRHLVTLIQIATTWNEIKNILKRTGQLTQPLTKEDEKRLQLRCDHVHYWLKNYAPDMVTFKIYTKLPSITLEPVQKTFLKKFLTKLPSINWIAEDIHSTIYTIAETNKIPINTAFSAIYQILLGQIKGPRAGYFLSNLDKTFIKKRVEEALK